MSRTETQDSLTKSIEASEGNLTQRLESQDNMDTQDATLEGAGDASEDEALEQDEFSKALEEALEEELDGDNDRERRPNKALRSATKTSAVSTVDATAAMQVDAAAAAPAEAVAGEASLDASVATDTPAAAAAPDGSSGNPCGSPAETVAEGSPASGSPLASPDGEEVFPMGSPTESPTDAQAAPLPNDAHVAAPVDHETQILVAVEQRAVLGKALTVVHEVCEEIGRAAKVKASQAAQALVPGVPSSSGLSVHADIIAKAQAEDKWKAMLDDDMRELKSNKVIGSAFKIAVHQDFEPERANLRQLTAVQVRALRTELKRLDKLWQLNHALAVSSAVVQEMDKASPDQPEAWSSKLEDGLKDLRLSDDLKTVLKLVAPDLVPADGAAEQWDTVSLSTLTAAQVRTMQVDLAKLKTIKEAPTSKPRALVRAMQALYHAESLEEAELSLLPETADEEALRQLAERSQEFAPALSAMRSVAVDTEVFKHLADESDGEGGEDVKSESEVSDVEKDLIGKKEMAPVVLPPGWRLEWVKRKKKEAREFVDPAGKRYVSIREVRAALEDWEARGGEPGQATDVKRRRVYGKLAAASTSQSGSYSGISASAAFGWDGGEVAKPAAGEDFFEGLADEMFGDMLDESFPVEAAPAAVAADSGSSGSMRPPIKPGVRVVLHSLVAKPELNGRFARLHQFLEDTGRWELLLEAGAACDRANVKPTNFTVLPATQQTAAQPRKRLTGKTSAAAISAKRQKEAPGAVFANSPARPAGRRPAPQADPESD